MTQTLDILIIVALVIVFAILCAGIYALFRGGQFGRSWSNKLMRARVLFQFIAVVLIAAAFWLKSAMSGG
ncbi:MAG: twin transmembrane helix small protein [Pseudomonadota bacterium]